MTKEKINSVMPTEAVTLTEGVKVNNKTRKKNTVETVITSNPQDAQSDTTITDGYATGSASISDEEGEQVIHDIQQIADKYDANDNETDDRSYETDDEVTWECLDNAPLHGAELLNAIIQTEINIGHLNQLLDNIASKANDVEGKLKTVQEKQDSAFDANKHHFDTEINTVKAQLVACYTKYELVKLRMNKADKVLAMLDKRFIG